IDTDEPHDLLDKIRRASDVGPPGRRRCFELLAFAVELDAERFQQRLDLARVEFETAYPLDEAEIEFERGVRLRRLAGDLDLAGLAAHKLEHKLSRKLEPGHDEVWIDAALESETCIGLNVEPAPGARRTLRIEIGRLDEHVGRAFGDARLLAAHHPAKPEHSAVVGDDAHVAVDLVGLAVERDEFLAAAAESRLDRALDLMGVIDMQRPPAVVGDEVGDVDQSIDG